MYPETIFVFEGQKFIVWATSKSSLGFKTHPDRDSGFEASPLKVNSVDYRVRFTAELLEGNQWVLYGQKNGRNSMTYWNTVFIRRTESTLAGSDPTESARAKITALAHKVIAAFMVTDAAAELVRDGRELRAKMDLVAAFDTLGIVRQDLRNANNAMQKARIEAEAAGVDVNAHLEGVTLRG